MVGTTVSEVSLWFCSGHVERNPIWCISTIDPHWIVTLGRYSSHTKKTSDPAEAVKVWLKTPPPFVIASFETCDLTRPPSDRAVPVDVVEAADSLRGQTDLPPCSWRRETRRQVLLGSQAKLQAVWCRFYRTCTNISSAVEHRVAVDNLEILVMENGKTVTTIIHRTLFGQHRDDRVASRFAP